MKKLITNLFLLLAIVAVTSTAPMASADTATQNPIDQCGNTEVEIKAFGAGLMYQPRPVAIAGERLSAVNINEKCAVVSWITDIPATSQVIFSKADEEINLDATKDMLGYTNATPQNNSAYVVHNAILKDLTPGDTYVYRVVSRSFPTAIPTVSQAYTIVIPKNITLPGSVSTAPLAHVLTPIVAEVSTTVPQVRYTTVPVVEDQVVSVTDNLLYGETQKDTERLLAEAATSSDSVLANVPAAITAAKSLQDTDSDENSSFWTRLKQAFSFFGGASVAKEVAQTTATEEATEATNIDASSFIARTGFLIPTLFILLFVFLIQQIALPMLGIIVERPIIFWMFSVIVAAIAAGLLKSYKITLAMIAVFLGLLAWYLLREVNNEVNGKTDATTAKPIEGKEEPEKLETNPA